MAGEDDPHEEGKSGRVSDAGGFRFELDGKTTPARGRRVKPANAAPAPDPRAAPHFHEHRTRLRKRFEDNGGSALADYELLEMFLFRVIPRRDTKPLAKALLARFGDLGAVFAAPARLIGEVEGAGPAVAQELKLVQAMLERADKAEASKRSVITSWTQLMKYCQRALAHEPREQFRVLFLDSKNQLIADEVQTHGTVDGAAVYPREVARRALELSAAAVILVHNHPSGDPTPSAADVAITREVVAAAKAVGVNVHDHVVVARSGIVSFRSAKLM